MFKSIIAMIIASSIIMKAVPMIASAEGKDYLAQVRKARYGTMVAEDYDLSDALIKQKVDSITATAQEYWDTMIEEEADFLWEDLSHPTEMTHVTSSYGRLKAMATAFQTEGSSLKGNRELLSSIEMGLERLYDKRYNLTVEKVSNWWEWEIGTPLSLCDTVILLYDELDEATRNKYMAAVNRFVKDPRVRTTGEIATGANLLWLCTVTTMYGAITDNVEIINRAKNASREIFINVDKGDGFYDDNSFIQHDYFPYTAAYGEVLLRNLAELSILLNDTPWQLEETDLDKISDWILNSYFPIMYNGTAMDGFSGRSITTAVSQSHVNGHGIMRDILDILPSLPSEKAAKIKNQLAYHMIKDTCDEFVPSLSIPRLVAYKKVLAEATPEKIENQYIQFASADRPIQFRDDYAFSVSMHSDRVYNFETTNGENVAGFHTADGMTYIFNDDLMQYGDDYWTAVDYYRLPGTTVVKNSMTEPFSKSNPFAGGVAHDGLYGVSGMILQPRELSRGKITTEWLILSDDKKKKQQMEARKSWFAFDDEIVAIGTVTAQEEREIETIIENRKINGANKFVVDGMEISNELGTSKSFDSAKWAWLEGNTEKSAIGYYFPNGEAIHSAREAVTANRATVNPGRTENKYDDVTKNYLSMYINHGVKPEQDTYEYVLLPGKTEEEVKAYNDAPDIEVVANTIQMQAVRENKLGLLGINFFEAGELGDLKALNPMSVMMGEKDGKITLSISDPTQKQQKLTLELAKTGFGIESIDPAIGISEKGGKIIIEVNTTDSHGRTFALTLKPGQMSEIACPAVYTEMSAELKDKTLTVGESTVLELGGIMSDGTALNLTDAKISVFSDNSDVVSISEIKGQKGKFKISGIESGLFNLYATIEYNGKSKSVVLAKSVAPQKKSNLPVNWSWTSFGFASSSVEKNGDQLILTTNGQDIWGRADDGVFAYQTSYADKGEISATMEDIELVRDNTAAGLMIRDSDSDSSAHVMARIQNGSIFLIWRERDGAETNYAVFNKVTLPVTLKLVRNKNQVDVYYKNEQGEFIQAQNENTKATASAELTGEVLYGIGGFSGNTNLQTTIKAKDISISAEKTELEQKLDGAVTLKIDKKHALIGTWKTSIDAQNAEVTPIIADSRTLLPIRFLTEAMGYDVEWNEAERRVVISGARKIDMVIDNNTFTVDGQTKTTDVAPCIINDRTMLPVRAIAEAMGQNVFWNEEERIVIISPSEVALTSDEIKVISQKIN